MRPRRTTAMAPATGAGSGWSASNGLTTVPPVTATPTGARGNGTGRAVHTRVAGSKAATGSTRTAAGSRRPSAERTVMAPLAALSGTVVRMVWSLHVLSATAAPTWPPPARGNETVPGASPKPKPSMTTLCPACRMGSMAPSTKSTRGTDGAGSEVPPQDRPKAAARATLVTAVLATHEADSLGQTVRQGGEFGCAAREVFNGSELFGRRGGDGFGFPARRGRGVPRLFERVQHPARQLGVGARHLGDALAGAGGARRRLGDAVQVLYPRARGLHQVAQVGADVLEQLGGAVQGPTGVLHRLADVAGLAAALLGELVDFVGDDRETAPVHARPGRLDRSVQGEEVRLVSDEADGLGELLHLGGDVAQATHLTGALFRRAPELAEAPEGALRPRADAGGGLLHLGSGVARLVARGGGLIRAAFELGCLAANGGHELGGARGPRARPLRRSRDLLARRVDLLRGRRQALHVLRDLLGGPHYGLHGAVEREHQSELGSEQVEDLAVRLPVHLRVRMPHAPQAHQLARVVQRHEHLGPRCLPTGKHDLVALQPVRDDRPPGAHRLPGEPGVGVEAQRPPARGAGVHHQLHLAALRVVAGEAHLLPRHETAGQLLEAREAAGDVDVCRQRLGQPLHQVELVGAHAHAEDVNAAERGRGEEDRSVAIAPVGSSAWAMPNHPSASAADARYTIVCHRGVSRASTSAGERP